MGKPKNIVNQRFGKLVATKWTGNKDHTGKGVTYGIADATATILTLYSPPACAMAQSSLAVVSNSPVVTHIVTAIRTSLSITSGTACDNAAMTLAAKHTSTTVRAVSKSANAGMISLTSSPI